MDRTCIQASYQLGPAFTVGLSSSSFSVTTDQGPKVSIPIERSGALGVILSSDKSDTSSDLALNRQITQL